jgi:hypothetical protein
MRFITECEWEGGAGEGAVSLLEYLEGLPDAVETRDLAAPTDDAAVASSDDADNNGGERTDEKGRDEWQIDGVGRPRARHVQRPDARSGGTR